MANRAGEDAGCNVDHKNILVACLIAIEKMFTGA
jgi:hypothetical protein